jgi:hypothetical protein
MDGPSLRDSAMTGLVLGFFASSWFGGAQERPPDPWRTPLIVGTVASLVVAVGGGVYAWRNWSSSSALGESGAMWRFIIIVWAEVIIAALGAAVLIVRRHTAYLAPWICLVVGLHFLPMAPVLENPSLLLLGGLLIAVAAVTVLVSRRTPIAPSAVTGLCAGLTLLGFATRGLLTASGWSV